jgi:hypothetical protein
MSAVRMSSADVLALNSAEAIVGLIRQGTKKFPEFALFPATPVRLTSYKTLIRTALPDVAFRAINAGRDVQSPTLAARSVDCCFLDASWNIDKAAVEACEWGPARAMEIAAQSAIDAMMKAIGDQIYYGTDADASGFAGVGALLDDDMVVNAGGDSSSACSSLYAFRTGIDGACLAWGNGGKIAGGEIQFCQIFDGDGKSFWGYAQDVSGYAGFQLTDYNSVGRICNLDSDHGLTDDLISALLAKFPVGEMPDLMFCSRAQLMALQQSRTATTPTGAPAPIPTDSFGVPLHASDSVLNTEAVMTNAGS